MTDTTQALTRDPTVRPGDPAMAASDPGMFAALTYDEDVILYQHLYSGWIKQRAVYPTLPEPWKETSAVLGDLTGACRGALQAGQEPEAGQ
jgi:hypothetical protein